MLPCRHTRLLLSKCQLEPRSRRTDEQLKDADAADAVRETEGVCDTGREPERGTRVFLHHPSPIFLLFMRVPGRLKKQLISPHL